jgi:hypothetical protein
MEKTSVEWFFNELQRMQYFIGNDMLEAYKQAKEMEKQQIIDAIVWFDDTDRTPSQIEMSAEQYYNQTFKQD